jgi:hypothetical protein|tara:strand:+ start:7 stop:129 length:123 start_codon:yes stop_codon:yes gene_type:complete
LECAKKEENENPKEQPKNPKEQPKNPIKNLEKLVPKDRER